MLRKAMQSLSLPSLRCRVGAPALGWAGPSSLRSLSSAVPLAPPPLAHAPPTELGPLALNRIRDNYGARLKKTRVGRGVGSGRGRKSGRGMKGMAARAGNKGFLLQSGGQTSDVKRIPKRGFYRLKREYLGVNLQDLQSWVLSGRLDRPAADAPITVKTLFDNRLITLRAARGSRDTAEIRPKDGRGMADMWTCDLLLTRLRRYSERPSPPIHDDHPEPLPDSPRHPPPPPGARAPPR